MDFCCYVTKSTKQAPGHIGVSELPVEFLGIIEQFVFFTIELGNSQCKFFGKLVACTAEPEAAGTVRVDKYE